MEMTKEEMNGRTRVIERAALLQEVKSDRGKEEKMKLKNQSVVVEPVVAHTGFKAINL